MFTSKELSIITHEYFKVKMCVSDVCELESQNGDHWLILKKQVTVPKKQLHNIKSFSYTYLVFHRHSGSDGFHLHTEMSSLLDCILEIINHDDYRLKRRRTGNEKTYFDVVVSKFMQQKSFVLKEKPHRRDLQG